MKEFSIGDNIQLLLKFHGDLSVSDLSRETKIPQPTLHHIIEGKTRRPRKQALEALAKFFSISVSQLTGAIPLSPMIPDVIKENLKISTVPLISWDLAKRWDKTKYNRSNFTEIILDKKISKNAFALQLQDSSMFPLFQENSLLIFDPLKTPTHRDFILLYFEKSDTLTFNRIFIDDKNLYVKQDKENGDAELLKIDERSDKIIATLVEARLKF